MNYTGNQNVFLTSVIINLPFSHTIGIHAKLTAAAWCRIEANTSSIMLMTANNEKRSRLLHYTGIV